jgi:hypothetical protein
MYTGRGDLLGGKKEGDRVPPTDRENIEDR